MSKKCLAIAKKAIVWTLAASMLVATPLTASAAGLRGVYSVSDGWNDDTNDSMTGTVSNTDTNSDSGVLKNNEASIMGIVLDKKHVDAEVGGKRETLTATVIVDGTLFGKNKNELKPGTSEYQKVLSDLARKIKWEVLNPDGTIGSTTNKVLSLSAVTKGDRTQVTLNPRRGTKAGEDMIVRAKLDGRYYYNQEQEKFELVENQSEGFETEATVSIKEYGDFTFKKFDDEYYVKHTLDMNDMVERDPATANDAISWEIVAVNPKTAAKINNAGVLTFSKEGTVKVAGVTEKGIRHESEEITISAGYPVSKIVIVDPAKTDVDPNKNVFTNVKNQKNKKDVDLGNSKDENPFDANVQLYSKVKVYDSASKKFKTVELAENTPYVKDENGTEVSNWSITDDITWTASKKDVATVEGDNDGAEITALTAGTAVITAKATSNKSAKLTVNVTATMAKDGLNFDKWDGRTLYSGQSVDLEKYLTRVPAGNKDALAWSIPDKDEKKSASISSKGVFKVANSVGKKEVTVKVQGKKQYKDEEGNPYKPEAIVKISVEQGDIRSIEITDSNKTVIAKASINSKNKVEQDASVKAATKNTSNVSVPKGETYTATVGLDSLGDASSLVWKNSDSKAKVVDFVDNGDGSVSIVAKAKGKAKVTVSGVYATTANNKTTGKAITTSFTINVTQPVETIKMNKTLVVLNQKDHKTKGEGQPQNVALKATLGPKGVDTKEAVEWSIDKTVGQQDGTKAPIDKKGAAITKTSVTFKLEKPMVGDEYVITAKTKSGASATTVVKVLNKTDKVVLKKTDSPTAENRSTKETMSVGDELSLYPYIETKIDGATKTFKTEEQNCESVEYSVNKKGIVTIDNDGKVYAVKKGSVTITVKTPTNKKATLKVTVK